MPLPARLYERDAVPGMVPLMLVRLLALHVKARHVSVKGMPDLATLDTNPLARFPAEAYCQLLIEAAEPLQHLIEGEHLALQWPHCAS